MKTSIHSEIGFHLHTESNTKRFRRLACVLAGVGLVALASACGSDGDNSGGGDTGGTGGGNTGGTGAGDTGGTGAGGTGGTGGNPDGGTGGNPDGGTGGNPDGGTGGAPPTPDCIIGETPYNEGDKNPLNDCELCKAATSTSAWTAAAKGTTCTKDGGNVCNASATCVECNVAADCPNQGTFCRPATCESEACGFSITDVETVLPNELQVVGDCKTIICDGDGGTDEIVDDEDVPVPVSEQCQPTNECLDGTPHVDVLPAETACTDNDGKMCDGEGACVVCVEDMHCEVGEHCTSEGKCAVPPKVIDAKPADASSGVSVWVGIDVEFSVPMDAATLTMQTVPGSCTGSIQVSLDAFVTCIAFKSAVPVMSADGKTAHLDPLPILSQGLRYKIRVTDEARDVAGTELSPEFTQPTGFTTDASAVCKNGTVLINKVYPSGGSTGAIFRNDFVELHNTGSEAVDVAGWSLQFAASGSKIWYKADLGSVVAGHSSIISAGGFFLVQMASSGDIGDPLADPDVVSSINMAPVSGKLALVRNQTLLSEQCDSGPAVVDLLGWGASSCYLASPAKQPSVANNQGLVRSDAGGCEFKGDNSFDFQPTNLNAATPPRSTMSTAVPCPCKLTCQCTANEAGASREVEWCKLQTSSISGSVGTVTPYILGTISHTGKTDGGKREGITAELGWGPTTVNPSTQSGFVFVEADPDYACPACGANDVGYKTTYTPAASGTFAYVFRFSLDKGVNWTYCDTHGSGSRGGMYFDVGKLGRATIAP